MSARFRPARLGLVSIAEYIDETFRFANGRLVLQGHNGAGKSKALELSIPLLFSGDTRPRNLDTFGASSKRLKDVVLWSESPKQTFTMRTGWVWLELECDEDGAQRHVTLGAGMHAHRDWADVRTRFFVLDGPRIGSDVHLRQDRDPVTFPHLREALGDPPEARIVDGAREFRALQDELLFGFGDEDRYQVMLRLLLALRRPNLSENMQPDTIGELLRETLPPVDGALVGRIGALLEELERIGDEQREAERAAETVRGVHEDYRQLAAAIARERATALHAATDDARRVERAVRAAGQRADAAETALTATRAERDGAIADAEDADARLRELRDSPEARAADALARRAEGLHRARAQARELEAAAAAAADDTADAHAAREGAESDTATHAVVAQQAAEDASGDATAAGVAGHAAAAEHGHEDPGRLAAALRALADSRRGELAEQQRLDAERERAAAALDGRRDSRDVADAELRERAEARAEADRQADDATTAHVAAVEAWAAGDLLAGERDATSASDGALADLLAHAERDGDGDAPGRAFAQRLGAEQRDRLHVLVAAARERARSLEAEREPIAAERDRLSSAQDPVVPAPAWRERSPDAPGGQPLWRLIEFAADAEDGVRGGLEGALHASGLLDALVADDGAAWRDGDVLLAPAPLPEGTPTLADVLRPDGGCDGALAERVRALLASVGHGVDSAPVWCADDGRCAVGPGRGTHRLESPRLIGAAARERLRAEQLSELDARLAALDARIADEAASAGRHDADVQALLAWLERYPDAAALRSAVRAAQVLARDERHAAERLRRAQERLDEAAGAARLAAELATQHRALHTIADDIGAQTAALDEYVRSAERLVATEGLLATVRGHLERATARAARAAARAEEAARAARDARRAADAEAAALDEARTAAGDGPAQALARIEALTAAGREARERSQELLADVEAQVEERATARAKLENAQEREREARDRLDAAQQDLRALGRADFLRLALGDAAPQDAQAPEGWDDVRCSELAALLADGGLPADSSRALLMTRFDAAHLRLKETLASHRRVRVFLDRTPDELPVLGARIDGQARAFVDVATWIESELARLRGLLDERQARLLSDHLADDVAEHLHERIHTAREWVDRTARTTARCRTSSGMGVVLRFRERDDDHPGLARAIRLLGTPPDLLESSQRDELVRFLFDRIEAMRATDGDESLERLLGQALDYRQWFRFDLQVRMPDGALVPFTRRRKDIGSGGEREVLLHLPLLAAAAAVYDAAAPHSPRLIALDEAFNKVDETGERGLLEAIVELDLDFLLCGYDLWCAHPEVPAVEIYHLKRWDDHFGIVPLHRFRWDGQRTVELDPAA
jgi:uncharacterized protein (TIGR02680 family)